MAWLTALLKSLPFAHPAMLLWGLAASVPIIIHLLSRRKYGQVTWAAMEFLLAAVRKNARRIRIEQLLLLLVRVAILVLLGMALGDPLWSWFPALGSSMGSTGSTHYLLVLDGSYSMDYRPSERSRFEIAQQLAAQVVQDSRQGDGFTLVLMADPPLVVVGDPAYDPKDAAEEIQTLRVRHAGGNLAMTLAEVEQILQRAASQHERLTDAKICFFTDLGRTSWDEAGSEECRLRLGNLAQRAELILFDVGQQETRNLGVTSFQVREPLLTVEQGAAISAEIQNFGSQEQTGRQLVLLADDQQVYAERLDIPPGGRAGVSFTHRFPTPGEHRLEARLDGDALAVDNHRWVSVPVRESIEVLCIEGRPEEALYVALALEPGRRRPLRVRVQRRFENALLEVDLTRFDAIFLTNVARFSAEESAALVRYLRAGGGLICILGDLVQSENYNQMLGGAAGGQRVLPARLDGVAEQAQAGFDPREYRHPIVAPFAGHEQSGLLTTPVWRYVRVTPSDPQAARVALAFPNGDPAIVEEPILGGRSILLTTAVSPLCVDRTTAPPTPWTALSTWPSFPPLVQEMLNLAVLGRNRHRNLLVGESLEGEIPSNAAGPALNVERPDGGSERVPLRVEGEDARWTYAETMLSGMYAARYGPPLDRQEWFAVNVDTRESNLERVDPDVLPSQFSRDFRVDEASAALPPTRPAQWFRFLLAWVFLLLLVECSLAWYIGSAAA